MDIADSAKDGDVTIEKGGMKIFLEKDANKMLSEATIDFSDEQGFIISGMQQASCRC